MMHHDTLLCRVLLNTDMDGAEIAHITVARGLYEF